MVLLRFERHNPVSWKLKLPPPPEAPHKVIIRSESLTLGPSLMVGVSSRVSQLFIGLNSESDQNLVRSAFLSKIAKKIIHTILFNTICFGNIVV